MATHTLHLAGNRNPGKGPRARHTHTPAHGTRAPQPTAAVHPAPAMYRNVAGAEVCQLQQVRPTLQQQQAAVRGHAGSDNGRAILRGRGVRGSMR